MSPNDIREFLRARPFVPFRMHTTEGTAYEVRHPDEAMVLATRVVIPAKSTNGEFAERLEHIALSHVRRIEELPAEASTQQA